MASQLPEELRIAGASSQLARLSADRDSSETLCLASSLEQLQMSVSFAESLILLLNRSYIRLEKDVHFIICKFCVDSSGVKMYSVHLRGSAASTGHDNTHTQQNVSEGRL